MPDFLHPNGPGAVRRLRAADVLQAATRSRCNEVSLKRQPRTCRDGGVGFLLGTSGPTADGGRRLLTGAAARTAAQGWLPRAPQSRAAPAIADAAPFDSHTHSSLPRRPSVDHPVELQLSCPVYACFLSCLYLQTFSNSRSLCTCSNIPNIRAASKDVSLCNNTALMVIEFAFLHATPAPCSVVCCVFYLLRPPSLRVYACSDVLDACAGPAPAFTAHVCFESFSSISRRSLSSVCRSIRFRSASCFCFRSASAFALASLHGSRPCWVTQQGES